MKPFTIMSTINVIKVFNEKIENNATQTKPCHVTNNGKIKLMEW
jgi:hypothetical protein